MSSTALEINEGISVTFSATVKAAGVTVTAGEVTFTDPTGAVDCADVTASIATDLFSCPVTFPTPGNETLNVTANYLGDPGSYETSSGHASFPVVVDTSTTTSLTSTGLSIAATQSVTFFGRDHRGHDSSHRGNG